MKFLEDHDATIFLIEMLSAILYLSWSRWDWLGAKINIRLRDRERGRKSLEINILSSTNFIQKLSLIQFLYFCFYRVYHRFFCFANNMCKKPIINNETTLLVNKFWSCLVRKVANFPYLLSNFLQYFFLPLCLKN